MKTTLVTIFLMAISAWCHANGFVRQTIGTPNSETLVSGVNVISGWSCDSKDIEIFIDGVSIGKAGAGTNITSMADPARCGRADVGFSLLYNFNNLNPGAHTVTAKQNGSEFDSKTFYTLQLSNATGWLSGLEKEVIAHDFPAIGKKATLEWYQSFQNFVITDVTTTANDLTSLNGTYAQNASISASGPSCYLYNPLTGNQTIIITSGTPITKTSSNSSFIYAITNYDLCVFIMTTNSGDSASGYNLSGTSFCASDPSITIQTSITGLKKKSDGAQLLGTVTQSLTGCTQTAVLY